MRSGSSHKIRTGMGQLWPKRNKVECLLRNNGDTRIFVWYTHKENGDLHVWHSHEDYGNTGYLCDIHTKNGVVSLRKRGKKVWQSTRNKGYVWNTRKQGGL